MSGFALLSNLYVAGIKCFSAFKFSLCILQGKCNFGACPYGMCHGGELPAFAMLQSNGENGEARLFVCCLWCLTMFVLWLFESLLFGNKICVVIFTRFLIRFFCI